MSAVEFGSVFQFIRNGMNVKQDKSGDGLPITRIETISNAEVDGSRVGYAGVTEDECRNWLLEPGDILFSHINSVDHIGKCAVYRGMPAKLGRICKAPPEHDRRDEPHGLIIGRAFFVPRRDAAKLLVPVNQPLNCVTLAVAAPVEGAGALFIRFPGDGDPDAMAPQILSDLTAAIGFVAHQAMRPMFRPAWAATLHGTAGHQVGEDDGFMPLTRCQE